MGSLFLWMFAVLNTHLQLLIVVVGSTTDS